MTDQRQEIPEKKTLHWLNLPDRLTEFAQETSIHGLSFVAQTSYSGLKRLTWFFLFLGSLMYAGLQLKTASEGYIVFHFVYSKGGLIWEGILFSILKKIIALQLFNLQFLKSLRDSSNVCTNFNTLSD